MLNYFFLNNLVLAYSGQNISLLSYVSRQRQEVGRIDALETVLVEQGAVAVELVDVAVGGVGSGVAGVEVSGVWRDIDAVGRLHL